MSEGWISLHRGWRDNPIFRGEYSRADAWIWLIENACWKPTRTRIKSQSVELQRGELSFAQRFMAEKWGWSKSRVDRFIADLRDEGMIETRSKIGATAGHNAGQGQGIITICNYAKYQDLSERERGNDSKKNGATAGQQRGKEEQGNKETSKKEPNGSVVSAGETPLTADELAEEWNELAGDLGLPKVAKLTDSRKRRANARLRQYPELGIWQQAFATIRATPFLLGDNPRGWRADFDFLLQDKSFTKLVEGSYGQA